MKPRRTRHPACSLKASKTQHHRNVHGFPCVVLVRWTGAPRKEIEERTLTSYTAYMKAKLLVLLLVFAFLLPLGARGQVEDAPKAQTALRTLGRAIANALCCVVRRHNQLTQ